MKSIRKKTVLLIIAVLIVAGFPYLKTSSTCGVIIPVAFTGAIFGCGGEKESVQQAVVNENTVVSTAGNITTDAVNKGDLKVTFVELGSDNCVPCRMMKPVMEQIKKTYPGQVKVVFHDVWSEAGRSEGVKYKIRVIPTQVFLDKNGDEYFRHEGFFPFEEIDKVLKQQGVN